MSYRSKVFHENMGLLHSQIVAVTCPVQYINGVSSPKKTGYDADILYPRNKDMSIINLSTSRHPLYPVFWTMERRSLLIHGVGILVCLMIIGAVGDAVAFDHTQLLFIEIFPYLPLTARAGTTVHSNPVNEISDPPVTPYHSSSYK
ncbi:hypothetical protein BDP27DRAFT_1409046 [Rhodocollybia butyracea]|uniref:Uncharacterized protein n=1 Tax=Rhodocollybia butyracea TaxID=206335 RepID=A0A9P5TX09_9AGAR|nr:hypothetical protein BDP27DRAFT_1409046 [Rhodocollybia butyracea]